MVATGHLVKFYADPASDVTQALGMVLDHAGPMGVLGYERCKRFAAIVDNGVVKKVCVCDSDKDPAGDNDPSVSCVENMIKFL